MLERLLAGGLLFVGPLTMPILGDHGQQMRARRALHSAQLEHFEPTPRKQSGAAPWQVCAVLVATPDRQGRCLRAVMLRSAPQTICRSARTETSDCHSSLRRGELRLLRTVFDDHTPPTGFLDLFITGPIGLY